MVYGLKEGVTDVLMALTVSKDGSKLAWTNPTRESLLIAHISSWNPFTATTLKVVPVIAFSPVFSPNGPDLVIKKLQVANSTTTNVVLASFNIASSMYVPLLNLSDYDDSRFYISDWVSHL